jgi:tRNA(adenine34) deaminase
MLDDIYFMKQALIEAGKAAERGEVPVGAVVVCKERIIARAHNLTETLNDVTAHAEMQAITAAANVLGGKYLNECTLYVTVEPCVMCAGAIAWAQTGKLVFGAEDEKRGYQKYVGSALHPKTVVVKGVMADECATLMKEFFAETDNGTCEDTDYCKDTKSYNKQEYDSKCDYIYENEREKYTFKNLVKRTGCDL